MKRQRKLAKVEPQVANEFALPATGQSTSEQGPEAASSVPEQRRQSKKSLDPAATLVEIAEAQALLRSLSDVSAAAKVIVERLERITSATAIGVTFLRNDHLEYCAAAGSLTLLAGSIVPMPANIAELLQKDKVRESAPNDARREHLQGNTPDPILFPFYDKTTMLGFLQLHFPETEPVAAHQIESCHVMANLMGEAVMRATELQWKQALAKEHAAVLEALERLKPQLERLTADGSGTSAPGVGTKHELFSAPAEAARSLAEISAEPLPDIADLLAQLTDEPAPTATQMPAGPVGLKDEAKVVAASAPEVPESPGAATSQGEESAGLAELSATCRQCGFLFAEGESFCGRCGTPRSMEFSSSRSELASESEILRGGEAQSSTKFLLEGKVSPAIPVAIPVLANLGGADHDTPAVDGSAALALDSFPAEEETSEASESNIRILPANAKPAGQSPWSSAARARTWLESLKENHSPSRRWLGRHQGDISVVIALLVLLLAIVWWSPHQSAPKPRTKAPELSLTWFERALVDLGLAEPPTVDPGFSGNPSAQVWEDVHTALYYCSGSEQYGNTDGGKVATQREAQLDQFKPAALRACE